MKFADQRIELMKKAPIPLELEAEAKYGVATPRRITGFNVYGLPKGPDVFGPTHNRASSRKARKPFGRKRLRNIPKQQTLIEKLKEERALKDAILLADSRVVQ